MLREDVRHNFGPCVEESASKSYKVEKMTQYLASRWGAGTLEIRNRGHFTQLRDEIEQIYLLFAMFLRSRFFFIGSIHGQKAKTTMRFYN